MAIDKEEFWYEDDSCMECGNVNYHESRVNGICTECYGEVQNSMLKTTLERKEGG